MSAQIHNSSCPILRYLPFGLRLSVTCENLNLDSILMMTVGLCFSTLSNFHVQGRSIFPFKKILFEIDQGLCSSLLINRHRMVYYLSSSSNMASATQRLRKLRKCETAADFVKFAEEHGATVRTKKRYVVIHPCGIRSTMSKKPGKVKETKMKVFKEFRAIYGLWGTWRTTPSRIINSSLLSGAWVRLSKELELQQKKMLKAETVDCIKGYECEETCFGVAFFLLKWFGAIKEHSFQRIINGTFNHILRLHFFRSTVLVALECVMIYLSSSVHRLGRL